MNRPTRTGVLCYLALVVAIIATGWPFAFRDSGVVAAGNVSQTVPFGCGWVAHGSSGNPDAHALVCNGGTLRGWVNVEGGRYVPGRPNQLNLNLSGGSSRHRGYVVLSPDNGKGTILEDGYLNKLLLVRGKRHGGTQFRIQPTMKRGLVACDAQGCLDVMKALRSANAGEN